MELEALLGADPPVHREAWHWIKGWYKAAVDHNTRPARVTLERIKAERGNCTVMYHHRCTGGSAPNSASNSTPPPLHAVSFP